MVLFLELIGSWEWKGLYGCKAGVCTLIGSEFFDYHIYVYGNGFCCSRKMFDQFWSVHLCWMHYNYTVGIIQMEYSRVYFVYGRKYQSYIQTFHKLLFSIHPDFDFASTLIPSSAPRLYPQPKVLACTPIDKICTHTVARPNYHIANAVQMFPFVYSRTHDLGGRGEHAPSDSSARSAFCASTHTRRAFLNRTV